jgi:hypothetical protein
VDIAECPLMTQSRHVIRAARVHSPIMCPNYHNL